MAAGQRSLATTEQLRGAGLTRRAIQRRREKGWLHPLYPGVYLVGVSEPPRLALQLGAVLCCGDGALLSHRSAAELWCFVAEVPGDMHVTVPRRMRGRNGVVVHRAAHPEGTVYRGIPVTSPLQTLADFAADASDHELRGAVAAVQQTRLLRAEHVPELRARARGKRGGAALGAILDAGVSPSRSRSEARVSRHLRAAGLRDPEVNVRVLGHEVDFLWREEKVILEIDTYDFHADVVAFERDRARDLELENAGYQVIRATEEQVPQATPRIAAALATRGGSPRAATTARARAR